MGWALMDSPGAHAPGPNGPQLGPKMRLIYIYYTYICVYIYMSQSKQPPMTNFLSTMQMRNYNIYMHILESSARFARALAYRNRSENDITELYYGIRVRKYIMELHHSTISQKYITELYYGFI